MDYLTLKKQVLNKYFSRTNDMQKKAVFRINGSLNNEPQSVKKP